MRLTDTCQVFRPSDAPFGDPRQCSFGHTGGDVSLTDGHTRYQEQARVIVGPDPALAAVPNVNGWKVEHKGKRYAVTAILPRYKTHGRLHHISLDLQVVTG